MRLSASVRVSFRVHVPARNHVQVRCVQHRSHGGENHPKVAELDGLEVGRDEQVRRAAAAASTIQRWSRPLNRSANKSP